MKNLIFVTVFAVLVSLSFDSSAKDKPWKVKKDKSSKSSSKSIPIDGGLSFFLLAAGAVGVSTLRKKKVS